MNIFFFILGGPGETYVESWGIKVSWRPHQTGYNKEKQWIINFTYMWKH